MTLLTLALLLVSSAGSADEKMPSDFLQVESKAWNCWLEEKVNTHWSSIPLNDVMNGVFGTADIEIEAADKDKTLKTPVDFDAADLTRRETLWELGRKYNFKVRWMQRQEPVKYLDLLETEATENNIGGMGIVTMTHVMRSDYQTYLDLKKAGKIAKEKQIAGTIYYSFDLDRDLHFENGMTAHVSAVQRYKTTKPQETAAEYSPIPRCRRFPAIIPRLHR
jgi:hypothetical protein